MQSVTSTGKKEKINLELVTLAKDNETAKLSVEELNLRKILNQTELKPFGMKSRLLKKEIRLFLFQLTKLRPMQMTLGLRQSSQIMM